MMPDTVTKPQVSLPDTSAALATLPSAEPPAHGETVTISGGIESLLEQARISPAIAADLAHRCACTDNLLQQPDPSSAAMLLLRIVEVCAATLGETHPAVGALRCRLGDLLLAERQHDQARQQFEIVLAAHRSSVLGDSAVIARALSGLGDALRAEGKYTAALVCLQRALRRQKELNGAHPSTAHTHTRLGALWFEQGDYTQARFHFQEALAIRETTLGPRDPATAQSLHNLGVTLAALGDLRSARVCLAQALAIREDRLGRTHLTTAQSLEALSRVLADLGDTESAEYCHERAAALYQAHAAAHRPANDTAAIPQQRQQRGGARGIHLFRKKI